MTKVLINTAEVAALLEYPSAATFHRHRATLMRDHAFPRPVPLCTREMKWRRDDVAHWMAFAGKHLPNGMMPMNGAQAQNVLNFARAGA